MRKRHSLTLALAVILSTGNLAPSFADVYVGVDANSNVVTNAIMCDAGTCSANSAFSQATLPAGAHYVLQGVGIDYGVGNNNPNTIVKVDEPTQTWTITNTQTQQVQQVFTTAREVISATPIQVVETATVMSDTPSVTIVDTPTVVTLLKIAINKTTKKIRKTHKK